MIDFPMHILGPVNALLSWSPFMVLSRLTYMGYLIHPVIMDWYYQNLQDTIIFSHSTAVRQRNNVKNVS